MELGPAGLLKWQMSAESKFFERITNVVLGRLIASRVAVSAQAPLFIGRRLL
jgi:hypothetical protein